MKIRNLFLFAFTIILCSSCAQDIVFTQEVVPSSPEEKEEPAIISGEVIVKFSDDMTTLIEEDLSDGKIVTKSSELNMLTHELGIRSMERVFPEAGEFEERTRAAGLHRWYRIRYDETVPATKAASDLSMLSGIEDVEQVRRIKNTAVFNDPSYGKQWHYYNSGASEGMTAGADINVLPVWETYTTGRSDVIVGVVDGGIDFKHEDLAANYIKGRSFVEQQSSVVPHDHGTHVAGTIAAVNNNGIGVVGIAGGDASKGVKGVGLLSCQIFAPNPADPNKDFGGDGASAIKWSADNGAVISQNSWGYVYETAEEQAAAEIPGHLAAAIDYFIANAGMENGVQTGPMKGGVVIFAAGNDAREHDPIGKYDPVIAVGAIGADMTRASYSNYGSWVDIAAPGGDAPHMVYSTLPGNSYGAMQGTSMACPHVSGVAALIVSHFGGPGFTAETLRTKLLEGADKTVLPKSAKIGPLLDALGSMTYGGKTPPEAVTSFEASAWSNNVDFKWKVTSDPDDRKAYGFLLVAAKDKALLENINLSSVPEGVVTASVMTDAAKVGDEISGTLPGLDFEQQYHVAIAAFDYNRNWSKLSSVKTVTTGINKAPVVTFSQAGPFKVKSHETLRISYTVEEPDGHAFKVSYKSGSSADSHVAAKNNSGQITLVGNAVDPGTYEAVLTVVDQYGLETAESIRYEILENNKPVVIKDIDDMLFTSSGQTFTIDMDEYLNDPDGEQLKYTISASDKGVIHINPSGNILHATVLSYGKVDVSITATDSRGETCVLTFKVVAKDPSKPLELYPNPVTDYLNVSTLDMAKTTIRIVSTTGKVVYDETSDVSAAEPAKVDMTTCPPGAYSVFVSFSGKEFKQTIVKL
ncbi:MAG: S8 family serine peptidase [Bacteroidales bacterium]|nr:S8 family serine peptidase [Bacteroidales bacterium]